MKAPTKQPSPDKTTVEGSGTNGAKACAVPTVDCESCKPIFVVRNRVASVVTQKSADVLLSGAVAVPRLRIVPPFRLKKAPIP